MPKRKTYKAVHLDVMVLNTFISFDVHVLVKHAYVGLRIIRHVIVYAVRSWSVDGSKDTGYGSVNTARILPIFFHAQQPFSCVELPMHSDPGS